MILEPSLNIILLAVAGALTLLWGVILAMMKWVKPLQGKHLGWLGLYVSLISAALIYIVIHTSLTQQETALKGTRARLAQELETFRDRLGQLTDKLMGQVVEKAELTQSEMEVRGDLQTERAEHEQTRRVLSRVRKRLEETRGELNQEVEAHRAYLDSLNTERALHSVTWDNLRREEKDHRGTRSEFQESRRELARARERIGIQKAQIGQLKIDLSGTRATLEKSLETTATAQVRLQKQLASQRESVGLLQASVDSIYKKVLKRPRIPPPPKD